MAYELGIDLNKNHALVSIVLPNEEEPVTLSMTDEDDVFVIPYNICRLSDGRWEIGYRAANEKDRALFFADDIFEKALAQKTASIDGKQYSYVELFGIYMQNICSFLRVKFGFDISDRAVVTVKIVNDGVLKLFDEIKSALPIQEVLVRDFKETFAAYVMAQSPGIYNKAVFLYEFNGKDLTNLILSLDTSLRPNVVKVEEDIEKGFGERLLNVKKSGTQMDVDFLKILEEDFTYMEASSVFLTGDGFEDNWAKESVEFICKGRRAFAGQNLFSKGACYLCLDIDNENKSYVYLGESKTKANLCIEINKNKKAEKLTLLSAGENWYETGASYRIVLEEGNELNVLLISPDGTQSQERTLTLSGLPERPKRTGRINVSARALSEDMFILNIKDLGFGEMYPASEKEWEYKISL